LGYPKGRMTEAARKAEAKNARAVGQKESDMSRKRWSMLAGLLAAGAAVGAAGALVMRRRKRQQWEEYGPSPALESAAEKAKGSVDRAAGAVKSAATSAAAEFSSAAESAAGKASSAIDKATGKTASTPSDELVGRTSSQSPNNRI
jgi:cytoskeletal protein RodZ